MQTTTEDTTPAARKMARILRAVLESIDANGTPAGVLYAALMAHGCTLEQFERIAHTLTDAGLATRRFNVLTRTPAGDAWVEATEGV